MKKLCYILLFIPVLLQAQNKRFDKGVAYFEKEEYKASLLEFSKAGDPLKDLNLAYYLARTNHLLQNLDTAFYYYTILDKANTKNNQYLIPFAELCMLNTDYDLAKRLLKKQLAFQPNHTKGKLLLESCNSIETLSLNPNYIVTQFIAINTNADDFSPLLINDDQLLFCSNRSDNNGSRDFSRDGSLYINIYSSKKSRATGFDKFESIDELNSNLHEGPMAYDPKSKTLYFTRSVKTAHKDLGYSYTLAIFKSTFNGEYWSKPEPFTHNEDGYSVGHPALSADGQKLYFISDKPGGFGKTDIYVSELVNGAWGTPKNLGDAINSAENELFPTVLANNDLAFSSNGRVGLGGLDIYFLNIETFEVINPGYPINSSKDDFGLISSDLEHNYGYFSSNRKASLGGDNIYSYKPISILVSGYLVDSISNKSVKDGQWRIIDSEGNIQDFSVDKKGFFTSALKPEQRYTFQFTAPNYNMAIVPFSTKNLTKDLDTLLNVGLKRGKTPILEGVVVDQVDTLPVAGAKVKLTEIDKGKSEQLETDTTGYYIFFVDSTKQYELNIDHPKFLVSLLPVSKIESTYKGYKKSAFEIKMVSIQAIEINKPLEIENIYYDYDKYEITPKSASILDTLEQLMTENDDIIVELSSHTDIRGSDEYNITLSDQRAQAAINYLVAKGIDEYRLVFKFYGKSELAVPCPNNGECPESVHDLNRRTEFRIIGF